MTNVNAHLHTPWSFSAFESIAQALDAAVAENVKVVGINDFYTTDGYDEWNEGCRSSGLYPLFGIEMMGFDAELAREGSRVNDPANPGRTYLSGKGLAFPPHLPEPYAARLAEVRRESEAQVRAMCEKLGQLPMVRDAGVTLDFEQIKRELTRGQVRERHLAKALRQALYGHTSDDAATENTLRSTLLKAGGAAFVAEDPKAFLPVADIAEMIRAAGGIPTYPFLGDDAGGAFTDFEHDLARAAETLKERGIWSVEFITTRNSAPVLERYAEYLWAQGFVVTMGSEHNTPQMEPVLLHTRDGAPLTPRMKEINYMGACVVSAHQDMMRGGDSRGYLAESRNRYLAHGNKLINTVING